MMLPSYIYFIFKAGRHAASADNSFPNHFFWDGESIKIFYDQQRVTGKTFAAESPASLLAVGSVIEHMDQAASVLGCRLSWTILAEQQPLSCYAEGKVFDIDNVVIPASTEKLDLFDRHTNRLAYKKGPLSKESISSIKSMSLGSVRLGIFDDLESIEAIAKLVYSCAEVRFQTQEIHEWLGKSFRFTQDEVEQGDGLDVATIDLPPGGKLFLKLISDWKRMSFLNKIGVYKILSNIDATPIKHAPALVSIVGGHSYQEVINAGRLMTRIWIELNAQGIAVQPYYVVADQLNRLSDGTVPDHLLDNIKQVEAQSIPLFGLKSGERLHMLLRLGYPKSTDVVRSRRLAMNLIATDLTEEPGK
ncbi:MAG: hypothetical protein KAJ63_14100 [Methyloprofundus sp.]|nr:hypothetical protein [Methyloprofundus sp.]